MYMNVVQQYNCQPQNNFSTLNITLNKKQGNAGMGGWGRGISGL